jgi:hypothetical protein
MGQDSLAEATRLRQQIEQCIEELRRGELTEQSLRRILDALDTRSSPRQDLLYLQTGSSSLGSAVLGMALVQDGTIVDPPDNPSDWPYKTPLEAVRDGWRVIQFPNLALMVDETRTYGLGCEFILEKWS